jgi:hypothetical protein
MFLSESRCPLGKMNSRPPRAKSSVMCFPSAHLADISRLCANCEVISEGNNGHCAACDSQALLSLGKLLGLLGKCRDTSSDRCRLRLRCERHRPLSLPISCIDVGAAGEQGESVVCLVPSFPLLHLPRYRRPSYIGFCIAATVLFEIFSLVVEFHFIDEKIRELCERAANVDDSGVPALFAELNALLAEHSAFVRYLAAKTLNRSTQKPNRGEQGSSSSNAAD